MAPHDLVWLITGTTSGIGAALVDAVAARGDKVIATGRKAEERLVGKTSSANVVAIDLDVSAPLSEIQAQVKKAIAVFGKIDVVVNNAAWVGLSCVEEAR